MATPLHADAPPEKAPGTNYTEARSGGDDFDQDVFLDVLGQAVAAFDEAGVAYVLMGGMGSAAHGRPRWTHDIDVFVRPEEAQAALDALAGAGFQTEETFSDWLYKGIKDDVLVDVIFKSPGGILLDDEMLARAGWVPISSHRVRVMAPEDLLVIKALVHDEHMPRHWHDALGLVANSDLDWEYVLMRARRHGARRVLSLLLYAQSNDLVVPAGPIRALFDAIFTEWPGQESSP